MPRSLLNLSPERGSNEEGLVDPVSRTGEHQTMEGTAGAQAASSPISKLPFAAEGLRHIPLELLRSLGTPEHNCLRCVNALAGTCKSIHRWFFTKFDLLEELMQRVVARRLAALERVADFLFAGQEAAWLRQLLRDWRTSSWLARNAPWGSAVPPRAYAFRDA